MRTRFLLLLIAAQIVMIGYQIIVDRRIHAQTVELQRMAGTIHWSCP